MFDWILDAIESAGSLGIFVLMLVENLFPPIPSELIMPLAGFHCANGTLGLVETLVAGTLGSVAGALPWYYSGRVFGRERLEYLADRHGAWLALDRSDVQRAYRWFQIHGWIAVLLGRLVPLVRTVISAPAGLARMRMSAFLMLTTLGSLVWVSALTAAGYLLKDQYARVEHWVGPISKLVVLVIVALYVYRIVTVRWRQR